jgi:signal transduction histidine kinase
MLKWIRANDIKLKEWLNYALGTLRKDKRRRKDVNLVDYLKLYNKSWKNVFDDRGIKFQSSYSCNRKIFKFRIFEVNLDCIFNNLVTNSITAFQRKDAPARRNIHINIRVRKTDIICKYKDSGPGLSKDITEPERIFEPHFTTRKDRQTGEDIGTGLGMWLVKSFVEDNNGEVALLKPKRGFELEIIFRDKIKK